ncbi:Metal-dependent hydrolase, endonuclease/exonuclease/phosphatase family [Sphingomonas laterariae]|uniref:Metal-dependent hydrolase, endonuclease/exonuclease/phosphatase family n=1 Tax=Edaphosphingomonas laterariae TaxID=861865 RepID=A0A239JFY7_9SPHN|nr:endonuclease/exonuclease/phosphatase family protein [Sphingomonas laterariae]SNT04946.1 Metal-dependent hydrolase, endonuclease/exonuclease/phosphatase family [Sphingomonas laterariae]
MGVRASIATAALLGLTACSGSPPVRTLACADARAPEVHTSPDGRTATAQLKVLTYNIEGLGWPARSGRGDDLRAIGERLAAMRLAGTAPDIVLFQEMFSGAAKAAVANSGYPAISHGPRRTTTSPDPLPPKLPGKAKISRGEIGIHFEGSGLAVASEYPIVQMQVRPYGKRACAGIDCLANKGIALARIALPGVPGAIDVYGTHMNSRGASNAPAERNLAAHERQSLAVAQFLAETNDDANPLIFGGDFNMRHAEDRFTTFARYQPLQLVHRVCAEPANGCEVRMSWDGDEPWMNTQDLQFYWPGDAVAIRPVSVEAMFDGGESGPELSDHDGFLVTYELSWPTASTLAPTCPLPAGGRLR